jgi:hypothetical protein
MERPNGDRFIPDVSMRLRQERDLTEQLRSDYWELSRLKKKVRKNRASREEKEKLAKLQSWIQMESRLLREIEGKEIETIICAEIKETRRQ